MHNLINNVLRAILKVTNYVRFDSDKFNNAMLHVINRRELKQMNELLAPFKLACSLEDNHISLYIKIESKYLVRYYFIGRKYKAITSKFLYINTRKAIYDHYIETNQADLW